MKIINLWLRCLMLPVFLFFTALIACGQSLPIKVDFKTPEVAAFNRNIEVPVSLYTGVPNISIPLYEIEIKGVKIPITLDYHAGGIRVDQEATWVGLGWSLNYGGQISRVAKGSPDEKYYYLALANNGSVDQFNSLGNAPDQTNIMVRAGYLNEAKNGTRDFMPDDFFYSAMGMSGKFAYSQRQGKFILFPKEDILITPTYSSQDFQSWNLKFPDGTSVDFGGDALSANQNGSGVGATTNAWLIKKVENVFNEAVSFTYDHFSYQLFKLSGQSSYSTLVTGLGGNGCTPCQNNTSAGWFYYTDSRIKTINFPNGSINFIATSRADMTTMALSEIDVLDLQGNIIRKINFQYGYFNGSSFDILNTVGYGDQVSTSYRYNRLRLDGLTISGGGSDYKNYQFDYYSDSQAPSKYSFAQDHWGFFNGINNSTEFSFIPNLYGGTCFTGGDRRVNPVKSSTFALKSITYPEGGKSEFIYENNTAGVWDLPQTLLESYQDDNIADKYASINISSYSRLTQTGYTNSSGLQGSPDYTDQAGIRYFTKQFTISSSSFVFLGNGFSASTNFGISTLEQNLDYYTDNAYFKLEKINADGTKTIIRDFNTTSMNSPFTRSGNLNSRLPVTAGTYLMTVALTYSQPVSSPANNQPYNLNFTIKWRELDTSKKMIYVGGIRVKDINYYKESGQLVKRKHFDYFNPFADSSMPTFTSGRVISLPQYYQYKLHYSPAGVSQNTGSGYSAGYCIMLNFFSNSVLPLETTSGSYCGYEYVDEIDVDYTNSANNNDLKTNYHFSFNPPTYNQYYGYSSLGGIIEPAEWTRGKLLSKKYYKGSTVIRQEDMDYYSWSPHLTTATTEDFTQEINTNIISSICINSFAFPGGNPLDDFVDNPWNLNNLYNSNIYPQPFTDPPAFNYGLDNYYYQSGIPYYSGFYAFSNKYVTVPYFLHYTGFDKPKSKQITTTDDNGNAVVEVENYFFDKTPTHYQQTRIEQVNSSGDLMSRQTKYPTEYPMSPYTNMVQRNMLGYPIEQSTWKNGNILSLSITNYADWGNNVIAPSSLQTQVLPGPLETRSVANRYDLHGNILEEQGVNDVVKTYLWGYNGKYPVAEITGATYATVSVFVNQTILDNVSGTYTDQQIRDELNKIRAGLAGTKALVTTYTYNGWGGITSISDTNNITTYFEYDSLQRLHFVKDNNGDIVKNHLYHYRNQN